VSASTRLAAVDGAGTTIMMPRPVRDLLERGTGDLGADA
jgi:hypothetical protein